MIRIIIFYHRFYVTMLRIMVNEYRVYSHQDGHAVQMCSSMGSRWWGHCETNSRPSDVALSVIPATLLTSSLNPPLTSHTSHLIADCAAWRCVCGALVPVMWWGNTQTSNHTGPMSVGNASLQLQELVCHVYELVIFHSKRKCQCYKGWNPYQFHLLKAELECESAATTLSDLLSKNCGEIHITIQVPGSSSLQEQRRRRLGKLLMAKVVRKSQKSEATAEKNHQNQKVSMNEPFS